jgi:hypothetical protein
VNRLVDALRARPEVVDELTRHPEASLGKLVEALGPAALSDDPKLVRFAESLQRDRSTGFLPTISANDWNDALNRAGDGGTAETGWWTVMVAGTVGDRGLTIPQDGSESPLLAVFAGPRDRPQLFRLDVDAGRWRTGVPGHCQPPSWGACAPGVCGGCELLKVWDAVSAGLALQCRCGD